MRMPATIQDPPATAMTRPRTTKTTLTPSRSMSMPVTADETPRLKVAVALHKEVTRPRVSFGVAVSKVVMAAGPYTTSPPAPATQKGAAVIERQDESLWRNLHARLREVAKQVRLLADREAVSPLSST